MVMKKHENLLLRNVPADAPLTVEIDVREFLAIISSIEQGGMIISQMSPAPQESADAYAAACGAMRTYFDRMLIEKFPPTYKA